ncbi:DMT family transporter [Gallibacterium salpingitidis]|uniref:Membrane protein n=1 Tax=Gallibacterium salpingitidis TaxID=505341 RepID=A0A1A7NP73_9PAST|nr:DMT family transporter [Gallibacterium salpingitidis]OBW91982.1 membrane protein [Gallibacterium salpingitidis]
MRQAERPLSGFLLALTTAICWGSLPLALQRVLTVLDSYTIVWLRFLIAMLGLAIILIVTGKLPKIKVAFNQRFRWITLVGCMGLAVNFILFNTSLEYINPSVSQVLGQVSPFFMMLAGVLIFKERLSWNQKLGATLLFVGLLTFFNERLVELFTSLTAYTKGVLLCVSAAIIWVSYAIAQKLLLRRFSSQQILLIFYIGAALIFTPFSQPSSLSGLNWTTGLCLVYCCLNTLVAYGAYAEALNRWEVAKVSSIITLTPLFTILFVEIFHRTFPDTVAASNLNFLAYVGAFIVVLGALCSAAGHKLIKTRRFDVIGDK